MPSGVWGAYVGWGPDTDSRRTIRVVKPYTLLPIAPSESVPGDWRCDDLNLMTFPFFMHICIHFTKRKPMITVYLYNKA